MATRRNWSVAEQQTIIRTYLCMVAAIAAGETVNKAQICRSVLPQLDNRTRGSYEMKLMNVSGAMLELGLPIVAGYKPYGHAQKSLKELILTMKGHKQ